MRKLSVVIVEDEELSQIYLKNVIQKHEFIDIIGICSTNAEAEKEILQHKPDLLILDIRVRGELIFTLLDRLKDRHLEFQILFSSAHLSEYIEESIAACQHAYKWSVLRKPVREDLLVERCRIILEQICRKEQDRIVIKSKGGVEHVLYEEILYFEAWGNDAKLIKNDLTEYFPHSSLKKLEAELPAETFYRLSSKHLINRDTVQALKLEDGKHFCYLNAHNIALSIPNRLWTKVKRDLYR